MTTKTFLLCATVALAGLVSANAQAPTIWDCPTISDEYYELPTASIGVLRGWPSFTAVQVVSQPWSAFDGGLRVEDINGDGLADVMINFGFQWPSWWGTMSCVYINNGHAWVPANSTSLRRKAH
jgi:hypothetical protein